MAKKKTELHIEYVDVDALMPYEGNARAHSDEDVTAIVESIKEFGFNDPIGVWEKTIVEGHGRLQAAQRLGMKQVPIIHLDHLTDEQRRAYALAHNKTAELSSWDFNILDAELQDIAKIDMSKFGFNTAIVEDPEEVEEDDFEPDEAESHNVEYGMVFVCGDHRVMCGDATSKEDADILMGGELADMVFTDPPYGVAIGSKNAELNKHGNHGGITEDIIGDTLKADELYEMLKKAFTNVRIHSKESCSYYVTAPTAGEIGLAMMMMMMRDSGLEVRHNLVWVKNAATFSMGRLDYDYRHEPIFYTWTKRHNFYGGYNNTVIDDSTPIDKMSKAELKEALRAMQQTREDSVIYVDKPLKCDLHPTMKPIKLISRLMVNSSQKGDVILDYFGGSGSTMITAEQLGRRAYLMEMDPHYVDVIVTRWEKFTGKKAKIETGA